MTTDSLITDILEREGGFVDHPADKGKATKFGITLGTLSDYRKQSCTVEDVRQLSATEARLIYEQNYIKAPGFDRIASDALRATLVDFGVHSGPIAAIRALQKAVGVPADGMLGGQTEAAANLLDGRRLALKVLAGRARKLGRIITDDPTQAAFAAGWMDRVADQVEDLA